MAKLRGVPNNQWRRSLSRGASCGDETPQRGVHYLICSSSHTVQVSGPTRCPSQQNTTRMTHHVVWELGQMPRTGVWRLAGPWYKGPLQLSRLSCRKCHKGWIIRGFVTQWQGPPTHTITMSGSNMNIGLIWIDRTSQGASYCISYGISVFMQSSTWSSGDPLEAMLWKITQIGTCDIYIDRYYK